MFRTKLLLLFILFTISTLNAQPINKEKSVVEFEIENMYISSVDGTFSGFSGEVDFDTEKIWESKIDVCIDASTVDTGNKKRDKHLRTEDFFHVEKYPKICFTSSNIYNTSTGIVAKGELQMHGVTKTVKIPLTYENKILEGSLNISRYDYNIGNDTGTFTIGEEVEIKIKCVLK